MKINYLSKLSKFFKLFIMMTMSVSLMSLSACSGANAEKADLIQIIDSFKQAKFSGTTGAEFQKRILAAKSEDEQKAVIKEMNQMFYNVSNKLNNLSLKSEEGKSVQKKLASAFEKAAKNIDKSMTISPNDKAALTQLQKDSMEAQSDLMLGLGAFIALGKKHGMEIPELNK